MLFLMTIPSKNNVIAEREQMCGNDDQSDRFVVKQTGNRVTMFYWVLSISSTV